MEQKHRWQVDLDDDTVNAIDQVALELRRTESNRKIGVGTIAARLLETLADHPELIEKLLAEYTRKNRDADGDAAPPFRASKR